MPALPGASRFSGASRSRHSPFHFSSALTTSAIQSISLSDSISSKRKLNCSVKQRWLTMKNYSLRGGVLTLILMCGGFIISVTAQNIAAAKTVRNVVYGIYSGLALTL